MTARSLQAEGAPLTSVVMDARQRQAAAALLSAAIYALAELGRGHRDPQDPMDWDDEAGFTAYIRLDIAIDAAHAERLDRAPLRLKSCQSCRHFLGLQSARGDQEPKVIEGVTTLGFCGRFPPARSTVPGRPMEDPGASFWPAVRFDHRCGEWQGFANYTTRL